jgi:hypothetical protein
MVALQNATTGRMVSKGVDTGAYHRLDVQSGTIASADSPTIELDQPSWLQRKLCGECFPDPESKASRGSNEDAASACSGTGAVPVREAASAAPQTKADPEGVAELLSIATDTVADERERGRALDTKSASLAGFTGLILSLDGALSGPLFSTKLGTVGRPVTLVLFLVAVLFLLLAVLLAVVGVLMPQKYRGMGREQLRNFNSPDTQAHDALWVHQSMLGALANILAQDRPVNDCKAKLTKRVALFLAIGFIFVAAEVLTIGVSQF